jgi:hypothetical protein
MTSRNVAGGDPSRVPIPNYGRGAFYGLAGALFGSAFWACYMAVTDSYQMLMPAAAGWFASACVKRGMERTDATGVALSIYFTAMIVFLGEYLYFTWVFFTHTSAISLAPPFFRLVEYFRTYPKDLFFMLLFTGLGFVIAVINCRESSEKKNKKKTDTPKKGEKDTKGEETA